MKINNSIVSYSSQLIMQSQTQTGEKIERKIKESVSYGWEGGDGERNLEMSTTEIRLQRPQRKASD